MTLQIQKRIEQIRRGEVPEGYQKTKVGIVPMDWKVVPMGDIYIERKEKGDPSLPVLTVSIHSGVSNGELDEEELGKKVKRIEDKTQYMTVRKDDLVFNMMRAWQGAIGVVQTDGLVSPAYIVAKPIIKLCPAFLDKYIKLPESINSLHKKSYGVTDFRLRLYWDSFVKVDCCLPPLPEQEKIAEILTTQDRVIELYEKIVEELKKLKKAFLQKMFPKPGANVPEWRFPDFTAPWEQRKVGECFSERVESDPDGELISVTIGAGIKKFSELGRHDNSNDDKSKYKKVVIGDIAYNSMRMWQGASGYSPYNGIVSPAYTVITPFSGVDSKFFAYMFKRENMIHAFQVRSQGITSDNWNLKFPTLSEIEVVLPVDINEQKAISAYFTALDNLITLHQRMCDEEKQKKKALMQLLLTGIVRVKT